MNPTENRTPGHKRRLGSPYINTAWAIRVTVFSTAGNFRPVSNFMELHALTLAARSYALLTTLRVIYNWLELSVVLTIEPQASIQ